MRKRRSLMVSIIGIVVLALAIVMQAAAVASEEYMKKNQT
jgi:hypothetical protein